MTLWWDIGKTSCIVTFEARCTVGLQLQTALEYSSHWCSGDADSYSELPRWIAWILFNELFDHFLVIGSVGCDRTTAARTIRIALCLLIAFNSSSNRRFWYFQQARNLTFLFSCLEKTNPPLIPKNIKGKSKIFKHSQKEIKFYKDELERIIDHEFSI